MTDNPALAARMAGLESLAREIQVGQASLSSGVEAALAALKDNARQVAEDAREARDGVKTITAILGEQNVPVQLEKIRTELKEGHQGLRSDLVNSVTKVRTDLHDVDVRVKALEDDKTRIQGGFGLFQIIKEYGAWLVALGAAFIAFFHQRPH